MSIISLKNWKREKKKKELSGESHKARAETVRPSKNFKDLYLNSNVIEEVYTRESLWLIFIFKRLP